jgi:hypothetical protein
MKTLPSNLACFVCVATLLGAIACGNDPPPATPGTTTSAPASTEASAPAAAPAAPRTAPPAAVVAPTPSATPSAASSGAECRAKSGAVELNLTWTNDRATGTLAVDGKSQPVVAQLYKGLVLVDGAGTTAITGKVATVTTEGKKTIRLGDSKQPSLDCN